MPEVQYFNKEITASILGAMLAMEGCMVGPDYKPPNPSTPSAYGEATVLTPASEPSELINWWKRFDDPTLNKLIEEAIASNPGLKQAQSRLRQARYQRIIAASTLWPSITATGSYQRLSSGGVSRGTSTTGTGSGSSSSGPSGGSSQVNLYQAGFDASWELDVFGGTRRGVEAATANIDAALEDERDVLVSLLAEVAVNYIDLRGYQGRIAIAQKNLSSQQDTLELTRKQFEIGTVTALDVTQAQAQVSTTLAQIPTLESSARQTMHLLSVLLGKDPMSLLELLQQDIRVPPPPPQIPVGLPSDLLRRRADVRRAERQLAAATANIGVAVADLFPKFPLTGLINRQGSTFESLEQSVNQFWSYGPDVTWPVFSGGRIWANIRVQTELQTQYAAAYEQAVLTALQDVEDALVAYSKEYGRRKDLSDAVNASRQALDLANQQYLLGTVSFLNVLLAQRALYAAEDTLAQSDIAVSTDTVTLYKALGGGWYTLE